MADEYIRKQDAIDLINKISNLDLKAKGGICVSLANLQKADVVPVVHGKWIKQYRGQVNSMCSVCGKEVGRITNFCSHCGAKMDKE